jgi:hypothetical protein
MFPDRLDQEVILASQAIQSLIDLFDPVLEIVAFQNVTPKSPERKIPRGSFVEEWSGASVTAVSFPVLEARVAFADHLFNTSDVVFVHGSRCSSAFGAASGWPQAIAQLPPRSFQLPDDAGHAFNVTADLASVARGPNDGRRR